MLLLFQCIYLLQIFVAQHSVAFISSVIVKILICNNASFFHDKNFIRIFVDNGYKRFVVLVIEMMIGIDGKSEIPDKHGKRCRQ